MRPLVAYAAAICAAAAAWLVRGALAPQSSAPNALKVGLLPPWWELGLFVLAAGCIVFLLRPSADRMLPLFATILCVLPWVPGVRSPALLAWTGPLGAALWAGAVAATMLAGASGAGAMAGRVGAAAVVRHPRYAPIAASLVALLLFSIAAYGARGAVPSGDEPHYLVITQSLLHDGDLQIENNHARREYAEYFAGLLRPDFWRRGQNGAIYSVHAPGLPALVAPAFLAGGYRGVVVFLVLVAALGACLVWRLAYAIGGSAPAAWFAVASTIGATPVAFHAFTVYPDGPAGVILLTGMWALLRVARVSPDIPLGSARAWALHGLALALLPWMHARLAALAGPLAIAILLRMPHDRSGLRLAAAFLLVPVISAIGWFGFFQAVYGTPSPAAPWTRLVASWTFIPGGISGILFDQQFGVLFYAPVVLVAGAGWFALFTIQRRLAIEVAAIVCPYVLVTTRLWIWWGGWSVPARFWVPLFWIGGVTAALAWRSARTRAARGAAVGALLVSAATTLGLAFTFGGRLAYNVRDGYAQWFDRLSPLADLPLGLPSFFRLVERQGAYHLQVLFVSAMFLGAFVAVRWVDRRVRGDGALALLLVATCAATTMLVLTVLWRVNGSTGLRASVAQLRLLDAARDERRMGLTYAGPLARITRPDAVLEDLRIESPPRLAGRPDGPVLVLPGWFPAGRYTIGASVAAGSRSGYEVRVLRAGPPILQVPAGKPGEVLQLTVTLPVDAPALILRGEGLHSAFLRPEHVLTRRERVRDGRANSARRYGSTVAWFLDRHAFDDPDGIWIEGGGAETRLLLQPGSAAPLRLLLRNGPVPNEATLGTDSGWSQTKMLNPGQESELEIPVDPARGAVLLRVASRAGFRPSEVDPGSRDARLLGVWMLPR